MADKPRRRLFAEAPVAPDESAASQLTRVKLDPVRYYLSTGSTLLDLAISDRYPGGIGGGRITQLYGDESTAKTLLLQELCGAAQRMGGTVILCDAEWAFDYPRSELFGLNVGKWIDDEYQADQVAQEGQAQDKDAKVQKVTSVARRKFFTKQIKAGHKFIARHPRTVEEMFDVEVTALVAAVKAGDLKAPVVIAVDSLSALSSEMEMRDDLEKPTMGTSRAKLFSTGFRKHIGDMAICGITMIGIDQSRTDVGKLFGDKKTTSGGSALKFYASTRIYLKHLGYIAGTDESAKVGVSIAFAIKKNKVAAPHRQGIIRVLFDVGVDDVAANLEWLSKRDGVETKLTKSGGWWSWGDDGVRLGQGLDKSAAGAEQSNLEDEIAQEVVRVWRLIHAVPDRKRRHG